MGHKKRNIAPRSNSSQPPPEPESAASPTAAIPSSSIESIKIECQQAVTALRRGNHKKALKLMKILCLKHETSALCHHVMGTVCFRVASITDDPNAKQRYLNKAIKSARKSVTLLPDSFDFSLFYVKLLFETANEGEYGEVVQECDRALGIASDWRQQLSKTEARVVQFENEVRSLIQKSNTAPKCHDNISTPEAAIAPVQNEEGYLIQKSNLASIPTRMKNLGDEKEKFSSIPMRIPEDPMELRSIPGRSLVEIKKTTKNPEERRREIKKSPQCGNYHNKGLDSGSGMGQRVGERRKIGKVRKNISSPEIRDFVRSYWNSMNLDWKKEFLSVRISDLKTHFSLSKEGSVSEVLDEALSFKKENKVWKFWLCCRCNEKFADADSHRQHVKQEHMRTLLPKLQSVIPDRVDNDWAEMLLNCSWKPLDLNAAIKMLEEPSKFEAPNSLDESYLRNDKDDSSECLVNPYCNEYEGDSSSEKKKLDKDLEDVKWMDSDEYQARKRSFLYKSWPSTDDAECAWLLETIHSTFELLIKLNYLASSHLSKVIYFAVQKLLGLADGSHLLNFNMDQTPLCICFLGATDLQKILTFLKEFFRDIFSCRPDKYSDKSNLMHDSIICNQLVDTMKETTFTLDDLVLVLDECFLPCSLNASLGDDACNDDSSSETSLYVCYENNNVVLDSDALLSWIYTGPSSGELLASWTFASEEKSQQGKEILQLHEKEFYDLQDLCEKKCEHLNYEEGLQAVNDLCCKERIKREHDIPQSYDSVLRKWREDIIGKSGEDDDGRTKNYLHQLDSSTGVVIELGKIDARILRVVNWMQQLEVKLDLVSAHDFRSILVPLVKSYLRAHLEDLAEKDATKKSDAAREAFLEELALDSEQGFGGGDNSRHMHERMKDKKKSKRNRRNKDLKATGGNGLHMIRDQTSEKMCVSLLPERSHISAHDWDDPDAEVTFAGTDVALRHQEEEYNHRIKLEFEERKLEETLKYERQIENEVKQEHLAEHPVSSEKENDEICLLRSKDTPNGNGALPQKKLPEMGDLDYSSIKVMADGVNVMDVYGPGLKNEVGENNCFLNVIIQVGDRHLDMFMSADPCVTCALYDIFISLSKTSTDTRREAVAPRSLRVALSNLYRESNLFREGEMDDASEVLVVIFNCLHQSFPCAPVERFGSLDCTGSSCIAHSLFGMNIIERMNCANCGLKSRHRKYTSYFHNINASALRTLKACLFG
ncbi:Ubiquitin carboxyl-terminal hydrolase-related protein [Abeliophyllum distichum]|uniref:Ubiquitin carboxyl-terminal hydrolase-related protein n=1 Tax=Abeliophyllum distichum TaxID=126358 RepID=A0ABD1PNT1_9LAMI